MSKIQPGEVRNPYGRKGKPQINSDGWQSVLTNLGGRSDPNTHTKYAPAQRLDRQTLEGIYRSDGIGKRVVDIPVDDAMREWVECDDRLMDEFKRINAKQEIIECAKWARLYGGSVLVALIDDGLDFEQPVNVNGIRRLVQLRQYERHRVTWTTGDVERDPMAPGFGEPTHYTVQPMHGEPYRVHRSRMWRFDGLALPTDERQRNNGWGDSALQPVYEALRNYGTAMNASANIVRDFIQVVLGVKGLTDMLRQGQDKLVADRANIIDMTRSVANLVMIDSDGETYDKRASSVAGLADLWDKFAMHVSATTGIPATKLLGKSPDGMNATGDSDIRQWYDVVGAYRSDEIEPAIDWIVTLLDAQLDWSRADRPETMDWQFPPLWQPSEKEWADIKKVNAETDALYVQMNAGVDAEYLYHLRFGGEEYRPDITYDYTAYLEWLAEREGLLGPRDSQNQLDPDDGEGLELEGQ